jgi:ribosomal protein S12
MAQHRTLMSENIKTILSKVVNLDGVRYRVMNVNHIRNGVYSLALKRKNDENARWIEVLVEGELIIYIDN